MRSNAAAVARYTRLNICNAPTWKVVEQVEHIHELRNVLFQVVEQQTPRTIRRKALKFILGERTDIQRPA
jgi:hypothetical protein